ncbi:MULTISPECIES: ExbD/TolR family protein [unclassified Lacinutrix]
MRYSKSSPTVNAGSMADIAFLLLIFFLVTTTIASDEGINRKLPRECPPNVNCSVDLNERNVLRIVLNGKDEILIENELVPLQKVKNVTKDFIDNNGENTCLYCNGKQLVHGSDKPTEAVISLQNDRSTSYNLFVQVQDEITKAYYELRSTYSKNKFRKTEDKLTPREMKEIREAYPFRISEAETK